MVLRAASLFILKSRIHHQFSRRYPVPVQVRSSSSRYQLTPIVWNKTKTLDMERSSPLAAMQPPSLSFGHGQWNFAQPSQCCGSQLGVQGKAFNFRDLSMQKPRPSTTDYFNVKPNRGSSPTASLAIDLSQNLHVDQRYVMTFHMR